MNNEPEAEEIHAELAHGTLCVRCSDRAFERLSRGILSEARIAATQESSVREIVLVKSSARPASKPSSRLRDHLVLAGCGIVALATIFVLATGVLTLYHEWLR